MLRLYHVPLSPFCRKIRLALREKGLAAELVSFLQAEFGKQPTPVWTSAIEVAPSPLPAKLYDEDTILGDFLRSVRDHLADDDLPLDAEELLGDGRAADMVSAVLDVSRPAIRQAVLREAATLGFDLLRGGATCQLTIAAEEASP